MFDIFDLHQDNMLKSYGLIVLPTDPLVIKGYYDSIELAAMDLLTKHFISLFVDRGVVAILPYNFYPSLPKRRLHKMFLDGYIVKNLPILSIEDLKLFASIGMSDDWLFVDTVAKSWCYQSGLIGLAGNSGELLPLNFRQCMEFVTSVHFNTEIFKELVIHPCT